MNAHCRSMSIRNQLPEHNNKAYQKILTQLLQNVESKRKMLLPTFQKQPNYYHTNPKRMLCVSPAQLYCRKALHIKRPDTQHCSTHNAFENSIELFIPSTIKYDDKTPERSLYEERNERVASQRNKNVAASYCMPSNVESRKAINYKFIEKNQILLSKLKGGMINSIISKTNRARCLSNVSDNLSKMQSIKKLFAQHKKTSSSFISPHVAKCIKPYYSVYRHASSINK